MPIEFWWWVVPLGETGIVTFVFLGLPACIIGGTRFWDKVGNVMAILAVTPLILAVLSSFIWFVLNLFILIWR